MKVPESRSKRAFDSNVDSNADGRTRTPLKRGRRGNREGSIFQRPDGRWVAAVVMPGGRRRVAYGKTRQAVASKLASLIRDRDEGRPTFSSRTTFSSHLDTWLETVRNSVRPRTYDGYRQHVKSHIEPELGGFKLVDLQPQDVQRLLTKKLQSGLSPRTVQYIHAVIRMALNQGLARGEVSRNVATLAKPPRAVRAEVSPLTPDEARRFLEHAQTDPDGAIYVIALTTGLRQGEILALRWSEVDLDAATLRVKASLQKAGGQNLFTEPKSVRSRRTIPLTQTALETLKTHRVDQTAARLNAGSEWEDNDLVFPTAFGRPRNRHNVTKKLGGILTQAGLRRQRFHDLRHGCASLLLAEGVPARVVMEMLGHSQISTTMDLYSHVFPEVMRDAASSIDRALRRRD